MAATGPGRHYSPLLSVTSSRNPFAVIARSVLADQLIPDGALVLLAILASLHRGKRPLTLSAKELAVSQGVMLSTHYDRRHRLMVLGYLDEGTESSNPSTGQARAPTSSGTGARRALGSL